MHRSEDIHIQVGVWFPGLYQILQFISREIKLAPECEYLRNDASQIDRSLDLYRGTTVLCMLKILLYYSTKLWRQRVLKTARFGEIMADFHA